MGAVISLVNKLNKRLITFKVTDSMIKWMNDMMSMGNYDSRSELVRDALEEFLEREDYERNNIEKLSMNEPEQFHKQ